MKNIAKLLVVGLFFLIGLVMLINEGLNPGALFSASAQEANASPTPPGDTGNSSANTATANPSGKKREMRAEFILCQDSFSEYGEAEFNHENHAFKKYSPDGKSVVACIECHHTDQPASLLKPPLKTSERDQVLTLELFNASDFKVSGCRDCHFQDGFVPDGKEMPTAVYKEGDADVTKELNNELAYHLNCNTCHDQTAALRPEVRKNPKFSIGKECNICHVVQ